MGQRRSKMKEEKGVRRRGGGWGGGDKVTRKNGARECGAAKTRTSDGESRKVMVGWSHLLLAAHRSSSSRVGPGAFGGEGGCARGEERTTRVPEVSGGYSVITVPSREPTNQTKRDKDKQRFEPTSARAGERIKRRHAEQTQGRKERKREIDR